jgi:integrase
VIRSLQDSPSSSAEKELSMRRRRLQNPKPKRCKMGKRWVWKVQYRDLEMTPRTKILGRWPEMSRERAEAAVEAILAPINAAIPKKGRPVYTFGVFVEDIYFQVRRRAWKASTAMTTEPRIRLHLKELDLRPLHEIERAELQDLLDRKAPELSRSIVKHLRWDLQAVFKLAVSERVVQSNPATALVVPKKCKPAPPRRNLTPEAFIRMLSVLDLRERLVVKLAVYQGMRPGEILALRWNGIEGAVFTVRERTYHGDLDTPKTMRSARAGALGPATMADFREWAKLRLDPSPDAFVFPSENLKTPIRCDNLRHRSMGPKLKSIELDWVNFQVMRRANASVGHKGGADPKASADQRGHDLGVSMSVYTDSDLAQKLQVVEKIEALVLSSASAV